MNVDQLEFLRKAAEGKLSTSGSNIWKALRIPALVQVVDKHGEVIANAAREASKVAGFRLTRRGSEMLDQATKGRSVAGAMRLNRDALPQDVALWVSAFKRLCRNCPKNVRLAYSDGKLHVLGEDQSGQVKDDEAYRLVSAKVPWHVVKA